MKEIKLYNVISNDSFFGIGEQGLIDRVTKEIKDAGEEDILLRINSPGGFVFDGQAIITNLKEHKGEKNMIVDSLAASMAGVLLAFADHVLADEYSMIMLHKAYGGSNAELLSAINTNIANMFKSKRGVDPEIIDKIFLSKDSGDYWFNAEEAKDLGLVDEITKDGALSIAASSQDIIDKYYAIIGGEKNKKTINNNEVEMLKGKEFKELEAKFENAQNALEDQTNKAATLEAENEELKTDNERLTQEIADLNEDKESVESENVSLASEVKSLEGKITNLENSFELNSKEIRSLSESVEVLDKEMKEYKDLIKKTGSGFTVESRAGDDAPGADSMAGFGRELNNENSKIQN